MDYIALILGAGKSTRMNIDYPKTFCNLAGAPLLFHLLHTIIKTQPLQICCVIGPSWTEKHKSDTLKYINERVPLKFFTQQSQLGTADAVKSFLLNTEAPDDTKIVVFCADVPGIKSDSIKQLLDALGMNDGAFCVFPSSCGSAYGRVVQTNNIIEDIVELKDERVIRPKVEYLANSGILCSTIKTLCTSIANIASNPITHEYYITDIVKQKNFRFVAVQITEREVTGVNTKSELATLNKKWQTNRKNELTESLDDPTHLGSIHFAFSNNIHPSTVIGPGVVFKSNVTTSKDVQIEAYSIIGPNVTLGENTHILPFSVIADTDIAQNCQIGPFAHLRGGNTVGNSCIIGNFVEVKKSDLAHNNKAKHLSYIGDTTALEANNFGAGFVTCNYDGRKKHQTMIGRQNFLGANSALLAPITIGDRNVIAAGSIINLGFESDKLAIARARQVIKNIKNTS